MSKYSWLIKNQYISEKGTLLEKSGKYLFLVDSSVNKTEMAEAVSKMFKVKVKKVNFIKLPGKVKTLARYHRKSKQPERKKAIVTLVKEGKIDWSILGGKNEKI